MPANRLTIKQEKFAQGLFAGLTQREAYKQAYDTSGMTDKSIDEKACELAKNVKITSRLDQLNNELVERNMVTKEKVLSELAHIAFDDISNYLEFYTDSDGNVKTRIKDSKEIDTRAISEVSQGKDGSFRFKMYCKDNALLQLGKHLGLFTDKLDATISNKDGETFNVSNLTDEELKAKIQELAEKIK